MRKKFLFNLIFSLFLFLLFLFSYSWIFLKVNPGEIFHYFFASLGSNVGVSVSVPVNPYNKLATELREWQSQLEEREKTLNQKEADLAAKKYVQGEVILKLILATLIIIFVLLFLNFYFDFKSRSFYFKKS